MLGLICLYFIGKAFFQLSEEHHKSKWLYAILGIVAFYAGQFLVSLIIGSLIVFTTFDLSQMSDFEIGLICLPFGALACWGFYRIMKSRWSNEFRINEKALNEEQIIDEQLID